MAAGVVGLRVFMKAPSVVRFDASRSLSDFGDVAAPLHLRVMATRRQGTAISNEEG